MSDITHPLELSLDPATVTEDQMRDFYTGACPIREHTADGVFVGRCDFATYDYICPRHGVLEDYPDNDESYC